MGGVSMVAERLYKFSTIRSQDLKRELEVGDCIVFYGGTRYIIGKILHQDFCKNAKVVNNVLKEGSYIDIRFSDIYGVEHEWDSRQGGHFIYRERLGEDSYNNSGCVYKFRSLFLNEGKTIREVFSILEGESYSQEDIKVALLECIGDCVWEE